MDKKLQVRVKILISAVIMIGFVIMAITSYATYRTIISDDIINISKLTTTNIYAEIRNKLTKPIFVSLTMANDHFLKQWLEAEINGGGDNTHQKDLQDYLLGIKNKYDYDSVFLVSDFSKTYYHYNGINKIMSSDNEHDQWYYSFLDSNLVYDLDVDTDEVNKNRLSVFVNCRIVDEDGALLGVTGVGLEVNQVQDLLQSFRNEFQLEAILFSEDGIVQVDSNIDVIEKENVFEIDLLAQNVEKILNNENSLEIFQLVDHPFDGYYITRYVEDLDWYLLVKKDTRILEKSIYTQLIRDILIFAFIIGCMLLITNRLIINNEKVLKKMAKTDLLTHLPNRRGFNDRLEIMINKASERTPFYVFVFDIDNFKNVNDQHGHLIGDKVLYTIGQKASNIFSNKGVISRWGGDEFAGYISAEKEEAIDYIEAFFKEIHDDPVFELYNITVSMGVTHANEIDTADTLIYRADRALYDAKGSGKDRYCLI